MDGLDDGPGDGLGMDGPEPGLDEGLGMDGLDDGPGDGLGMDGPEPDPGTR
jgi:hypothetical protein